MTTRQDYLYNIGMLIAAYTSAGAHPHIAMVFANDDLSNGRDPWAIALELDVLAKGTPDARPPIVRRSPSTTHPATCPRCHDPTQRSPLASFGYTTRKPVSGTACAPQTAVSRTDPSRRTDASAGSVMPARGGSNPRALE